jgi:hypothetical protein
VLNFGDSSKFGDSALNCMGKAAAKNVKLNRQLSALSPNLELSPKFCQRGWP